jgi:hypothetical protein
VPPTSIHPLPLRLGQAASSASPRSGKKRMVRLINEIVRAGGQPPAVLHRARDPRADWGRDRQERSRCLEPRPGLGRQRVEQQGDRSGVRGSPAKNGTAAADGRPQAIVHQRSGRAPRSLALGGRLGREGSARRGPPAESRRPFASLGGARKGSQRNPRRRRAPRRLERRARPRPSRGCAPLQKLAFYRGGSWV